MLAELYILNGYICVALPSPYLHTINNKTITKKKKLAFLSF